MVVVVLVGVGGNLGKGRDGATDVVLVSVAVTRLTPETGLTRVATVLRRTVLTTGTGSTITSEPSDLAYKKNNSDEPAKVTNPKAIRTIAAVILFLSMAFRP